MASNNALSSLASRLTLLSNHFPPALRNDPRATAALAVTALGISIPTLAYAIRSYRGYIALGPGGMPYNIFGWALQGFLQLLARHNTRDPTPFSQPKNRKPYEPFGTTTYLTSPIPLRQGDRPEVPGYVAPQRQLDQRPAETTVTHARMNTFLESLAVKNPGVLVLRPSHLERRDEQAVFLDTAPGTRPLPPFIQGIRGESAHAHPECSSHVILSMVDAEEVVRKGWAERHKLSGVAMMPWSYMFVYAPRDEVEFEIWKGIMKAGLRFVCASAGREIDVDV